MEQKSQLIFEIEPEDAAHPHQTFTLPDSNIDTDDKELKVRLDKWLWAARFFKTRALARSAVEQGKVLYDNQKITPSKEIELGASLQINQGKTRKIVIIKKLSTRRRSTDEANGLFEITSNIYDVEKTPVDAEKRPRRMMRFLRRSITAPEPIK